MINEIIPEFIFSRLSSRVIDLKIEVFTSGIIKPSTFITDILKARPITKFLLKSLRDLTEILHWTRAFCNSIIGWAEILALEEVLEQETGREGWRRPS